MEKCAENAGHAKDNFAGEGAERKGKEVAWAKFQRLRRRGEEEKGGGIQNSGSGRDQVQDGRIQSTGCKEGEQEVGLRD